MNLRVFLLKLPPRAKKNKKNIGTKEYFTCIKNIRKLIKSHACKYENASFQNRFNDITATQQSIVSTLSC